MPKHNETADAPTDQDEIMTVQVQMDAETRLALANW